MTTRLQTEDVGNGTQWPRAFGPAAVHRRCTFPRLVAIASILLTWAVASSAHLGDFRVAIWNSLGSDGGAKWTAIGNMLDEGYNVILLQEVGTLPGRAADWERMKTGRSWPNPDDATRPLEEYEWEYSGIVYYIYFLPDSKNMAIVTPFQAQDGVVIQRVQNGNGTTSNRGTPGVRLQNPFANGGTPTWFFSVHAGSFGPNNRYNNVENLLAEINDRNYPSWAAGGDWNRDLGDPNVWPNLPAEDIVPYYSGEATQQNGGELDYLISNELVYGEAAKRMGNPGSDHWPVCFEFDLSAAGSGGGPGPDDHDAAAACVVSNHTETHHFGFWRTFGACAATAAAAAGAVYTLGADTPLLVAAGGGCVGGLLGENLRAGFNAPEPRGPEMLTCKMNATHGHDFTGHHRRLADPAVWTQLYVDPSFETVLRPNGVYGYVNADQGVTFWEHHDQVAGAYQLSKMSIDVQATIGSQTSDVSLYYDVLGGGIFPLPENAALASEFNVDPAAQLDWARLKLGEILAAEDVRTQCSDARSLACNSVGAAYCFLSDIDFEICKWEYESQTDCEQRGGEWHTPGDWLDQLFEVNLTQAECIIEEQYTPYTCNADCTAIGAEYCMTTGDGTEACGWHARTVFFCSGTGGTWTTPESNWAQTHDANLTQAECLMEL